MVANLHESSANAILGTTLLGPCVKCRVIGIKIHHFADRPIERQGTRCFIRLGCLVCMVFLLQNLMPFSLPIHM